MSNVLWRCTEQQPQLKGAVLSCRGSCIFAFSQTSGCSALLHHNCVNIASGLCCMEWSASHLDQCRQSALTQILS
jgi:hypothetical protein